MLLLVPFIWLADQWTKAYADENLSLYASDYKWNKNVSFRLVYNKGAALGIFKNRPKLLHGITLLGVLLLTIMGIPYWFRGKGKLTGLGLALMLGGALGNYTDRLTRGHVVDFVAFKPKYKVHFNLADFAIFKGGLLVFLGSLFK